MCKRRTSFSLSFLGVFVFSLNDCPDASDWTEDVRRSTWYVIYKRKISYYVTGPLISRVSEKSAVPTVNLFFVFFQFFFFPFLSVLFTFLLHSCLSLRFFHPIFVSIPSSHSFSFFNLFLLWSSLKWLFERNEKSKDCTVRSFHRFLDKEKRTRKKKERNAPYSTNLTHPFGGRVNKRRDISLLYSCVLDLCFFFLSRFSRSSLSFLRFRRDSLLFYESTATSLPIHRWPLGSFPRPK